MSEWKLSAFTDVHYRDVQGFALRVHQHAWWVSDGKGVLRAGRADDVVTSKRAAEAAAVSLADAILAELAPERDVAERIAAWLETALSAERLADGDDAIAAAVRGIRAGEWKP